MDAPTKKLADLHNLIVDYALVIVSVIAAILLLVVYYRFTEFGFNEVFLVQYISISSLFVITLFRKRISFQLKIYFISLIIILVYISGLYAWGFLASAKIYLAMLPILHLFVFSYRKSLYSLLLLVAIYAVFGYLYISGIISYTIDLNSYVTSKSVWMVDTGIILLTSWGLLFIGHHYKIEIQNNSSRIKSQVKEIADHEKKYRLLFEEAGDAITLVTLDGRFFDGNKMACKMFKCSKEDLIGRTPFYFSPEYQSSGELSATKARKQIERAIEGQSPHFDWQHKDIHGNIFETSITLNKIELSGETYVQGILKDITQEKKHEKKLAQYRKNLEKKVRKQTADLENTNRELEAALLHLKETQSQLVHAEKMASLGILTAGVAHEINNPLNYIMGSYVGLQKYFETAGSTEPQKTAVLMNGIKTGIERTSKIVNGLNQFSRKTEEHDEECNIHLIISNCLEILNHQLKNRINVDTLYAEGELIVKGNVGKLHQVFTNIIINAIHAVDGYGEIRIKTNRNKDFVEISTEDNGCGINPENIEKITDPFFTTKDPGKGTGLGLSISYKIIKEHRGEITFESEVDKGTRVSIRLPILKRDYEREEKSVVRG